MADSKILQQKLENIVNDYMLAVGLAIGSKLKLFDALAEVSSLENPALPKDVADKAGCKERYVKEWLCTMACGDIIEVTEDEKFFIKPENVQFLNCKNACVTRPAMNIALLEPFPQLLEVIKKNGPLGLSVDNYSKFHEEMSVVSESLHKAHLISDLVPLLGIKDQLEVGGLRILNVGCWSGLHAALLAERFTKCQFIAIDSSEIAIEHAKGRRKELNNELFENLEFRVMDAAAMPTEWTEHFDLALIFDSCHDQLRPDLVMREIHRVLKPGCKFAMVEVKGTSNIYEDKQKLGSKAIYYYGASLLHCLPVASNSKDALGAGAMWGRKMAESLLQEAGFSKIEVTAPEFFPSNLLYTCYR